MSVPKSKRKESRFEAQHQFFNLRREVTTLVLNDFGFSEKKYLEQIELYQVAFINYENTNEIVERWKKKNESFQRWFIDEEGRAVIDLLRQIEKEFTVGKV